MEIATERDGDVLIVTFDRAAKKNALTIAMYRALSEILREVDFDPAIRAVLFQGAGGSFCAGNDLTDFLDADPNDIAQAASGFLRMLVLCERPLVAAVAGPAIGVGTTMLFHCDLVYVAPDAIFRMPFVDLGLVPEGASSLLVPQRVGLAKAAEFLMLGDGFDAAEALRLQVANAVIASDRLLSHAREQAHRLAAKPPELVGAIRRLLRGDRSIILNRIDEEIRLFAEALRSPPAQAALRSFRAKHSP